MEKSSLKIGTLLKSPNGEYRIDNVLGSGSFGITYLATSKVKYGNVSFNVKFAIKEHFMDTCFRDDNGVFVHCTPTSRNNVELSRKDFFNEANRLMEICQYSKNIVHVNEAFEANGTAYYVMEYLNGGSPGITDEKTAVDYIRQIAEAVQILHEHKLLHLDIKPDNIVFKRDEEGGQYPVLIDFGITKHFDEKGRPTSSPNVKGISQGYAPIEQNDVLREFSPTLDIYALGATLLYMLTGKNPPSSVRLIDSTQKELRNLMPSSVSESTRNAILRAMKPNKNERTQTISSFLNDLKTSNCKVKQSQARVSKGNCNTEPISKGSSLKTEPLNRNKILTNTSKWHASHWTVLVTSILSLVGICLCDLKLGLCGSFGGAIVCILCLFLIEKKKQNYVFLLMLITCLSMLYLLFQHTIYLFAFIPLLFESFMIAGLVAKNKSDRWGYAITIIIFGIGFWMRALQA